MALGQISRIVPAFIALFALSACVSEPGHPGMNSGTPKVQSSSSAAVSQPKATLVAKDTPQPRTATYNCADGGMMTIENVGTAIRVLGPDGISEELPASPAGQNSRFGVAHDAIVIDGREVLVMKGNATPIPCTR